MSPALAGGFQPTATPGKSSPFVVMPLVSLFFISLLQQIFQEAILEPLGGFHIPIKIGIPLTV